MPRRVITFPCEGATLFGTLDEASGRTGLLIVSGGNEIRIGAHRGMAWLAAQIAAAGYPVLRYDRRGIGDSEGDNGGFEGAGPDLGAALAAFREHGVDRVIGFGNCDAASLLALDGRALDGLILANPWVIEAMDDLPAPAAIRARYAQRLRDPAEWRRLLTGGVDLGKLARGLGRMLPGKDAGGLAQRIAGGLRGFGGPITLLLAERDNTAIAFADAWRGKAFDAVRDRARIERLPSASHSFASAEDQLWLREKVLAALV
ncbi:hydrolase 1, exosortase A system-associated [Sphingomonas gilva]|uniref:Hydrolase 1, exosortase A system-associated n=1 Tax=Sphingomonas gilva TaxID=2305907 RepID=A0A396RLD9_9SPHN|nr:hydrolase 1, exosortase A system-associated [Sphingomonas gilva]RHW17147.1 hydrolase 1, exosortase A system-associated [Sphingomonas gilva]